MKRQFWFSEEQITLVSACIRYVETQLAERRLTAIDVLSGKFTTVQLIALLEKLEASHD